MRKHTLAHRLPAAAALAALTLALSGCISLGGGKVPDTLLTLTPAQSAPAGATVSGQMTDALLVFDPDVARDLSVQRVAVTVDASNIAYLKNALWAERPARLFGALLTETLRARGKRLVFSGDERAAVGNDRLTGRLLALAYDAPSHSAVVRYDAVRNRPGGVVETRRFESVVPVSAPEAAQVGPALNQAANAVAAQVADWVG